MLYLVGLAASQTALERQLAVRPTLEQLELLRTTVHWHDGQCAFWPALCIYICSDTSAQMMVEYHEMVIIWLAWLRLQSTILKALIKWCPFHKDITSPSWIALSLKSLEQILRSVKSQTNVIDATLHKLPGLAFGRLLLEKTHPHHLWHPLQVIFSYLKLHARQDILEYGKRSNLSYTCLLQMVKLSAASSHLSICIDLWRCC